VSAAVRGVPAAAARRWAGLWVFWDLDFCLTRTDAKGAALGSRLRAEALKNPSIEAAYAASKSFTGEDCIFFGFLFVLG